MTLYRLGDIVLVGFPHTDLQVISKRPAVVIYDSRDQDVLMARITTQEYTTETDYRIQTVEKRRSSSRDHLYDLQSRRLLKNSMSSENSDHWTWRRLRI